MKYNVKKIGIGCDAKNVKVFETNNIRDAIKKAIECYKKFDFTDKLFYYVIITENEREIMNIAYYLDGNCNVNTVR
jgi:hypothetical protein